MSDTVLLVVTCGRGRCGSGGGRDHDPVILRLDLSGPELAWSTVEPGAAQVRMPWLANVLEADFGGQPTIRELDDAEPDDHEPERRLAAVGSARLSGREQEALSYIAAGFTHAQTATRMGVTKATVDTYVDRIRRKLGLGNKAELTRAALSLATASPHPPERVTVFPAPPERVTVFPAPPERIA